MKKLTAMLMCLLMLFCSVVSASAAVFVSIDEINLGDANGDGVVDAKDTLMIKQYMANYEVDVSINNCDMIADGKATSKDLLAIKKCMAGVDSFDSYASEEEIAKFTIAGNDLSEYSIVIPSSDMGYIPEGERYTDESDTYANVEYSSELLSNYVYWATGVELTIDEEQTTAHKIEFVNVYDNPELRERLDVENYQYEVLDGDLYIYGTRRGNMYAVYEILEDYFGYRFYSNSYIYQYEERYVDIPEGTNVFRAPYLEFRYAGESFGKGAAENHFFARRLNGIQISIYAGEDVKYGTLTGPHFINAHSYGYYWKMGTGTYASFEEGETTAASDFSAVYAEKYNSGYQQPELEWNPCFTSDDEYDVLFRGLIETIRYINNPGWHTFREKTSAMSFSICDNREVCTCNNCKYISSEGTFKDWANGGATVDRLNCGEAGLNLYLANRACRDVEEYYDGRAASWDSFGDNDALDGGGSFGEAITDEWPGMKLYTILYGHETPHELLMTDDRYADIRPEDNLIIMFCGNPCNNHYMGSGECGDELNILGQNGYEDAMSFKAWGEITKITGAEMWFWYYPVSYNFYIVDAPNVLNVYYDFKFVVEECNVTGIYYEGSSSGYGFEHLRAHLAALFMWECEYDENGNLTIMTEDEFTAAIKEYMKLRYGEGYELIYEYMLMLDEAGNQVRTTFKTDTGTYTTSCYVNNCDYPGDMYSYSYVRDNYEEMRSLLTEALAIARKSGVVDQYGNVERLFMTCEALGLSAVYQSWYADAEEGAASRDVYLERYDYFMNYIKNKGMSIAKCVDGRVITDENWDTYYRLDCGPLQSFCHGRADNNYIGCSWKDYSEWGYMGSKPGWGYYG